CGTTIKDYGFMFRDDPKLAEKAARVSALAKDICEYLDGLALPAPARASGLTVAYHSACSMQHGQKIVEEPKKLLRAAGFTVKDVPEGHICCGSAGVYNILQPGIAGQLRERKIGNIARTRPDIVATGNIGCITQIAKGFADRAQAAGPAAPPVVHTVELLDWALGGPVPEGVTLPAEVSLSRGRAAGRNGARDPTAQDSAKVSDKRLRRGPLCRLDLGLVPRRREPGLGGVTAVIAQPHEQVPIEIEGAHLLEVWHVVLGR
ncbi:MAG: heterodisulfide reductase-related iron-sulfur binding cluster, partial [Hyphomicrobiales bacterium]